MQPRSKDLSRFRKLEKPRGLHYSEKWFVEISSNKSIDRNSRGLNIDDWMSRFSLGMVSNVSLCRIRQKLISLRVLPERTVS